MIRIDRKPLSVNEVWQGKRFKTDKYSNYEKELLFLLPKIDIPSPPFEIYLRFGFSSKLSDWDNPIKPFQDVLCKKYGFDDRDIIKATVEKVVVKKGQEFIEFNIKEYETNNNNTKRM